MAFEIEWTGPARAQFSEIVASIRTDNPLAAERFSSALFRRVQMLGQFPRSGAVYLRRRGRETRQIVYRKYRVFYRVRPRLRRIEVLAVWHGARREPKLRGM